jgi:protein gp37
MSDRSTTIEWTDVTWNPVRGCTKVSPGCAHCYAETFAERFRGVKGHPYEQGFDLRLVPEQLTKPLTWKKPRRVFVNSMSDLFQDGVPEAFILNVLSIIEKTPQHTYQLLTKRPARMLDVMRRHADWFQYAVGAGSFLTRFRHLWLGVSVENQHFADERIPLLLQTPAAVRFISAEPLLGPITFGDIVMPDGDHLNTLFNDGVHAGLDWVIVGGESGPGARPFDLAWARSIIAECQAAGVACFVKQLGANAVASGIGPVAKISGWTNRKGGDPDEWPADLRVREFPESIEVARS